MSNRANGGYEVEGDSRASRRFETTSDMQVGDIDLSLDPAVYGYLIKTHGDRIVSLNDPRWTWSKLGDSQIPLKVQALPPGTKITLTVK